MSERSLVNWLKELERQHPIEIDLGTERSAKIWRRLKEVLHSLCDTQLLPLTISVAGTNGKGSCVASMEAMLLAHGYSVGAFTSPHFLHYNERVRIDGVVVTDNLLIEAFEQIAICSGSISLTYFEYGTLAALWVFARRNVDVRLLEVGLGGRLDAVNIVDADVAIVTSIALDHQDWLGDTVEEIAAEKLGIARPNKPLIWGDGALNVRYDTLIARTDALVYRVGRDFTVDSSDGSSVVVCSFDEVSYKLTMLDGEGVVVGNKACALQALLAAGLSLDEELCRDALNNVSLTGRHQTLIYDGVTVLLDVAHNPAAAALLASRLCRTNVSYFAVASVLSDKDWSGIVDSLSPVIARWYVAEINTSERAADAQQLVQVLYNKQLRASWYDSISAAFLTAIKDAGDGGSVVVLGSFHTVTCVLSIILSGERVD